MENSQGWRPDEVARFGNMNTSYSRPIELTQDIEIPVPRVVRIVRTVRGLPATAKAPSARTDSSTINSKGSSLQIAALFIQDPTLAMLALSLITVIVLVCILVLPIR